MYEYAVMNKYDWESFLYTVKYAELHTLHDMAEIPFEFGYEAALNFDYDDYGAYICDRQYELDVNAIYLYVDRSTRTATLHFDSPEQMELMVDELEKQGYRAEGYAKYDYILLKEHKRNAEMKKILKSVKVGVEELNPSDDVLYSTSIEDLKQKIARLIELSEVQYYDNGNFDGA